MKKYIRDETLPIEDQYKQLEEHHIRETEELVHKLTLCRAERDTAHHLLEERASLSNVLREFIDAAKGHGPTCPSCESENAAAQCFDCGFQWATTQEPLDRLGT